MSDAIRAPDEFQLSATRVDDDHGRLARRIFQLQTLNDASFELSRLVTSEGIADSFLLTAMGALGATQGFILIFGPGGDSRIFCSRGFSDADLAPLRDDPERIRRSYFSSVVADRRVPLSRPHILLVNKGGGPSPFPPGTEIVVKWVMDEEYGFVVLGNAIKGDYSEDDKTFLLSLTATFLQFLGRALFIEEIRRLNDELGAGNVELQESLAAAKRLGADLDRQVFHLKSVNDTVNELSGLLDSRELMQRFLLLSMGAVSAARGFVILFSEKGGRRRLACRGMDEAGLADVGGERVGRLVTRMLFASGHDSTGGLRRGVVEDSAVLTEAGLPRDMPGVWFVLDDGRFGYMGLGDRIAAQAFDSRERDFLAAAAGAFTVFLRNAGLYEEKTRLIEKLATQNLELQRTLDNLTKSRQEIDFLQAARQRLRDLVCREMDRVGRVSLLDFVLIVGVSLVIGLLFNTANPSGVTLVPAGWGRADIQAVDPALARSRLEKGTAIIVDARPREFYEHKHIPGAVNLPLALFDFVYGMELAETDPAREIVVYGGNVSRRYDDDVAALLLERGHAEVKLLSGGLAGWEKRGFPVEP